MEFFSGSRCLSGSYRLSVLFRQQLLFRRNLLRETYSRPSSINIIFPSLYTSTAPLLTVCVQDILAQPVLS